MYPNLDEKIGYLRDKSLKQINLDVLSDNERKYADLYQDFLEKRKIFSERNNISFVSIPVVNDKKQIFDVQPLLVFDDKDFVERSYKELLKQDVSQTTLVDVCDQLSSKKLTKVEFINKLAETDEFKSRDIVLTGYPKMSLDSFMQYINRDFIDFAYVSILKRYPDAAALSNYLKLLYSGDITYVEILHDLINAPVASYRNLVIDGLEEAYAKVIKSKNKKIYSFPIIGKLARFVDNNRKLNASLNALSERVISLEEDNEKNKVMYASHVNELQTGVIMLSEELKNLNKFTNQFSSTSLENNRVIVEKIGEISALADAFRKDIDTKAVTENRND